MSLVLTITEQSNNPDVEVQQKVFDRNGGTIGRSSTNNWVLPDKKRFVSSYHARIYFEANNFYLLDISTNGVFFNKTESPLGAGTRVKLSEGDRLRIGEYDIAVSFGEVVQQVPANTSFDEWLNDSSPDSDRLIDESMDELLESSFRSEALSIKNKAEMAFQALSSSEILMRKKPGVSHDDWAIDDLLGDTDEPADLTIGDVVLDSGVKHIVGLRVDDLDMFDDDPVTISGAFQSAILKTALGIENTPLNNEEKKALQEKVELLMANSLQQVLNGTLKQFEPDNLAVFLEGRSPELLSAFTTAYTDIYQKLIDDREIVFEPLLTEALTAACQQLVVARQSDRR